MNNQFTKMHGLGNDFIVFNALVKPFSLTANQIQSLAHRQTGIGFDQCLILESSLDPDIDFFYRIFNADGKEVGQCGNGARCLARFIQYYGLSTKTQLRVATATTQMTLVINADNSVTVDMAPPLLEPASIPLLMPQKATCYDIPLEEGKCTLHALSVGNPHAVITVANINQIPLETLGKHISEHPLFPAQVNVGFMQIVSPDCIKLRVYERGAGETLACGSGAVAAAAIGRLYYDLAPTIKVHLPGGELKIDWPSFESSIYLSGPATFVYEGTLL